MITVGLTGGIASGKSTVTNMLRSHHLPVVDCDEVAHQQLEKGRWAYRRVLKAFGRSILRSDGEVDRDALGAAVFGDPTARKRLNAATHLPLALALVGRVLTAWLTFQPILVVDMPLLFETGASRFTRPRVLVACDEHTQLQRLMARNGLTAEQASARVGSQMPLEAKRKRADVLVDNDKSLDSTRHQVSDLVRQLNARRWRHLLLYSPLPVIGGIVALAVMLLQRH